MRPTGRLHLGNYWGALRNWVALQNQQQCYFFIADWHMLTTGYEDTSKLQDNIREMALDWLAAGLDPNKCVIFKQSDVPEHVELAFLFSMITPIALLENNPTYKDQLQELSNVHIRTHGFLGYPVLQAADILLYRGSQVPIGHDQLPHLELSREIARKFNALYGELFPEPQPLLTPTPKVPGLDGRKMSKSYGNALDIYETAEALKTKTLSMYTDPTRKRTSDPGHPEPCTENPPGCTVFAFHKLYASAEFVSQRKTVCEAGQIGCMACKKDLLTELEPPFAEFRQARERFAKDAKVVADMLVDGARKAAVVARSTMGDVRRAMRLR